MAERARCVVSYALGFHNKLTIKMDTTVPDPRWRRDEFDQYGPKYRQMNEDRMCRQLKMNGLERGG